MINSQLVMDALIAKIDYACMCDYHFNRGEDYEWILGREIVYVLREEFNSACRYRDEDDSWLVLGIPVTLDYKDSLRISLVKEIKR